MLRDPFLVPNASEKAGESDVGARSTANLSQSGNYDSHVEEDDDEEIFVVSLEPNPNLALSTYADTYQYQYPNIILRVSFLTIKRVGLLLRSYCSRIYVNTPVHVFSSIKRTEIPISIVVSFVLVVMGNGDGQNHDTERLVVKAGV